jgi:endonuclease/exonuclease/phosphatase family metal-dependent hydrolase
MKNLILIFLTFFSLNVSAQTNFKVMFYNLLHYPSAPPTNRDDILKNILNGYAPDLFLVCELEDQNGANSVLDVSLSEINKNYAKTVYTTNQSSGNSFLSQLIYYNTDYFVLDNEVLINTDYRDINHYTFIIKTADYLTNPTYLEVFVTHLKALQGNSNEQLRLQAINQFIAALNNLDPNSFVLFGGDFNVYTSEEPAYQKILDTNNSINIKDVLNLNNTLQDWHTNSNWIDLFTQSTRTSNSGFDGEGAGGGFDDRFDFIFLSENLLGTSEIQYKPNSYQNYGNNGNSNCFNGRIDSANCSGALYNQALRNDLYNMSDHLPVVLELETNETLSVLDTNRDEKFVQLPQGNLIKNELVINFNDELINKNFKIYNTIGQTLFLTKITTSQMRINTSFLDAAIYYIFVEDYSNVIKFVKE